MDYDIRCNSSHPNTVAEGARRERERAASLWRNGPLLREAPLILTSSSATTSATNFRQKQSSFSVSAPGDFLFLLNSGPERGLTIAVNSLEGFLRKSPKDARSSAVRGQRIPQRLVLKNCAKSMSQTVHTDGEQPFVDDLYMKHMAAFVSNGQQMEARVKDETRGNGGNNFH